MLPLVVPQSLFITQSSAAPGGQGKGHTPRTNERCKELWCRQLGAQSINWLSVVYMY